MNKLLKSSNQLIQNLEKLDKESKDLLNQIYQELNIIKDINLILIQQKHLNLDSLSQNCYLQ
ncbi:unnamed protein product [Paramecium sonneborni]|uniref:Uncharacterized protein n=1 Tax=Paramecium sonneborni TaxID=65129 RepID=A0A8S1LEJ6_9CILI|nr:unnamed protein product [Paramecium sonneborni]